MSGSKRRQNDARIIEALAPDALTSALTSSFLPNTPVVAAAPHSAAPATSFTPTEALFTSQWHFSQLGNITAIWSEFTGEGIHVGIYDEGVQYTHTDLDGNYDSSLHVVVDGITYDGANVGDAPHGTSVAGLIAAESNGQGTVGVAFDASITGVNIFDSSSDLYINAGTPTGFYDAVRAGTNFDVINNSWGSLPGFYANASNNVSGSFAQEVISAWQYLSDNGRDGLGTIVVKSAGNDDLNSNAENGNSTRYTITIAAARNDGFASSYSNYGADVLVSASAGDFANLGGLGIVTSDLVGTDGYNLRANSSASSDYTDDFGGTSAAAPIVSGVVSLMLDANSGLGWRDVQDILSIGAVHTGSAIGATSSGSYENGLWFTNGGSDWNGGGRHFSVDYGYGLVNAYNSVRVAEAWQLFGGSARTSANEQHLSFSDNTSRAIADLSTVSVGIASSALDIEHIDVTVTLTHTYFNDLIITLVSPDGKEVMLTDGNTGSYSIAGSGFTWTFGVDAFHGEDAQGTWTVRVKDQYSADTGTLSSVKLDFYGATSSVNDVYHFTDEFSDMAALDRSRRFIEDSNGGTDWVDAAAVTTGSLIDFALGFARIDGIRSLLDGIENVVTGDGSDRINGDGSSNKMVGGRGSDLLTGGQGADSFAYLSIADSRVGSSHDVITDFGVGDDLIDLSLIDAKIATDLDDAFKFLGTKKFDGKSAGELVYSLVDKAGTAKDVTLIAGDVDGDKVADFQIQLTGLHKLTASDFIL